MQAKTVAFVATTKPVTKKKVVKKKATGKSGTFLGQSAQTQFGPVQVSVSVSAGRITKVTTPIYPTGTYRDQAINSQLLSALAKAGHMWKFRRIHCHGNALAWRNIFTIDKRRPPIVRPRVFVCPE